MKIASTLSILVALAALAPTASPRGISPQISAAGQLPRCQSLEDVNADVVRHEKLTVPKDEVLIAGYVLRPQPLKIRGTSALSQVLAEVGGALPDADDAAWVFRSAPWRPFGVQTDILSLKAVREGRAPDIRLQGGEVVYLTRLCKPLRQRPSYPAIDPTRTISPSVAVGPGPGDAPNNGMQRTRR